MSGKENFIRQQLSDSLTRLGTDYIDLYYMHRMDVSTPIEETMSVLKSLVQEGKIRYIGLSECTANELRRAHAVHPITAIQMEWSLANRDIEGTVVPIARELGVGRYVVLKLCMPVVPLTYVVLSIFPAAFVAYSPLNRGFLTAIDSFDSLDETDRRKAMDRYQGELFQENKRRVQRFFELAAAKGCTPSQLALAWVHAQGDDVFPIPGTKSSTRIVENAQAFTLLSSLTAEDVQHIAECAQALAGERKGFHSYNQRL